MSILKKLTLQRLKKEYSRAQTVRAKEYIEKMIMEVERESK